MPGVEQYIKTKPQFETTYVCELPPAVLDQQSSENFEVPPYLTPAESCEAKYFSPARRSFYSERAEKRAKGVYGVAALAIQRAAINEQCDGLSIDRPVFRETIPEINDPAELVVAAGLYASLLTHSDKQAKELAHHGKLTIYELIRDDVALLLSRANEISEGLVDEEIEIMHTGMIQNIMPNMGRSAGNKSYPIFMLRNAIYDIVGNPRSPLDPATIMGTKLVRFAVENRHNIQLPHSMDEMIDDFIANPSNLIRNPELFFLFEQSYANKKKISRAQAEQIAGATVNSFFDYLGNGAEPGSFGANVAKGYFSIADRVLSHSNVNRKYVSGSSLFLPTALTNLAVALSNATDDQGKKMENTQVHDFAGSFEYVLQTLEAEGSLQKFWPGVEPQTRQTFIHMLVSVAGIINQPLISRA